MYCCAICVCVIAFFQLAYVLDKNKDPNEDILSFSPGRTLARCDFWSLAYDEVEAQVIIQYMSVHVRYV